MNAINDLDTLFTLSTLSPLFTAKRIAPLAAELAGVWIAPLPQVSLCDKMVFSHR
jgi:hypothetical protein